MKKLSFHLATRFAALTLILGISFGSCKKAADDFSYLADGESVVDHADTETEFDDVDASSQSSMSERGVFTASGQAITRTGCPTVTLTATAPTVGSIVIDFGTGCRGRDGRIRKGIINVTYTGRYMDAGSVITMIPSNYFVSSKLDSTKFNKLEGTRRVTNITGATGNPKHRIEIIGGKRTSSTGDVFQWEANRIREWSIGSATPLDAYDDEFTITNGNTNGTAGSGITRKNVAFTVTISPTKPVVIKTLCFLQGFLKPVSGVVTFASTDASRTIDYGVGACDRQITVTFEKNGRSYTVIVNR